MVARGKTLSEEQRRAMTEGRERAKEAGRIVGFPVRCAVRVDTPQEPRFHGKTGTVSEHNLGEIGVRFSAGGPAVWFLPNMLIRVANEKRTNGG